MRRANSTLSVPDQSKSGNNQMRLRDLKQKEVEYTKAGKFIEAEYTQNQIKALKEQIKARAEKTARVQDKENKKHIEEQCRKELEVFHTEWDRRIKEHVQNAKRAEQQLQSQHDKQLNQLAQTLVLEQPPKAKFSSTFLRNQKHLQDLIKAKQYRQADKLRSELKLMEAEQTKQWNQKYENKKKIKYRELLRKQQFEFNALRTKFETQFNDKLKEREAKLDILINKNQKRKIEQEKTSKLDPTLQFRSVRSSSTQLSNTKYTKTGSEEWPNIGHQIR